MLTLRAVYHSPHSDHMSRTKIKAAVAGAAATNAELSSLRFLQMTSTERRNTRLFPSLLQTKKEKVGKSPFLFSKGSAQI
jgi:hypothetical protein